MLLCLAAVLSWEPIQRDFLKKPHCPPENALSKTIGRAVQQSEVIMKFVVQAAVIFAFISMILAGQASDQAGAEGLNIIGVQPSHDLKHIKIKFSGQVGRHTAYVVERPYRLVMDFEATGLGKVPPRIKVDRGPIREIRLGSTSSRARVVVDFGENPVPPFNLSTHQELVVVTLGKAQPALGRSDTSPEPLSSVPPISGNVSSPGAVPTDHVRSAKADSLFSVKGAGITDDLIFVELADRWDPRRIYRLVVDFDYQSLQLRKATLSDSQGNLKRFDFASNAAPAVAPREGSNLSAGPRKAWAAAASGSQAKHVLKSGGQWNGAGRGPVQPTVIQKSPVNQEKAPAFRATQAK